MLSLNLTTVLSSLLEAFVQQENLQFRATTNDRGVKIVGANSLRKLKSRNLNIAFKNYILKTILVYTSKI